MQSSLTVELKRVLVDLVYVLNLIYSSFIMLKKSIVLAIQHVL